MNKTFATPTNVVNNKILSAATPAFSKINGFTQTHTHLFDAILYKTNCIIHGGLIAARLLKEGDSDTNDESASNVFIARTKHIKPATATITVLRFFTLLSFDCLLDLIHFADDHIIVVAAVHIIQNIVRRVDLSILNEPSR